MQLTEKTRVFSRKGGIGGCSGFFLKRYLVGFLRGDSYAEELGFAGSSSFSSDIHTKFNFFLYCYDLI